MCHLYIHLSLTYLFLSVSALSGSSYGFNVVLFCQWLEFLQIPLMHIQGFCQILVYLGYIFR